MANLPKSQNLRHDPHLLRRVALQRRFRDHSSRTPSSLNLIRISPLPPFIIKPPLRSLLLIITKMPTVKSYIFLSLTIVASLTVAKQEDRTKVSLPPAPQQSFPCPAPLKGYCTSPYLTNGVAYYVSSRPIVDGKYSCQAYGGSNSSCCDPAKLRFIDAPDNQKVLTANFQAACSDPNKKVAKS
ncbi:hypothetical protein MJO28_008268 [Puccinia striiformis f. sp. tritici]|uniref:Uncharacterized protein n=1 Tax=Puccinia striiformis f. sp. tritici TaxID=168172 RepID=A0ACC0EAJ2_9BASI|nr:hypothetical protein MJO28_008268 [Puccinia striiformis f. sp. tritici]KAI7952552.1 hypothetical protein MJO29_008183 [Puccinia striiformis f. sp. tritici]